MKRFDARSEQDWRLDAAQAALLERFAPDTEVRRVTWSHGRTQILELGTGPPLLLVHGGGDGAFVWAPILPALARSHRVLAVDRPGHGSADTFDYGGVDLLEHASLFLREIVDSLELPVVDIVGNGLGGLWAVAFALDAPDRVSRLVLAGAPAGVTREVPVTLRLLGLPIVGRRIGRLLMSDPTREGSRRFWGQLLVTHPERVDDALLDADIAHTRRNLGSILSLIGCTVGVRGLRRRLILGERWQALQMPTLIVCGEADAFATPRMRDAWDDMSVRNPNIRILSVPGAGNHLWVEDPERVADELQRFLATPVRAELPNL
jgi:pimeloyl-ACP methyl ester carboxylesterase